MVVLSKLQLLCDFPFIKSCRPLHFSGHQHCSANAIMCFLNAARACTKYYVPVYIVRKLQKINQQCVKMSSFLVATCISWSKKFKPREVLGNFLWIFTIGYLWWSISNGCQWDFMFISDIIWSN